MSHPIAGAATSITAFIGRTLHGPSDAPGTVNSFADFERLYGGLWAESTLGYAVSQFFQNGGSQALIVRAGHDDGGGITDADITEGLLKLDKADLFNLLCIPPLKRLNGDLAKQTWDAAIAYARSRRAFVIVDPSESWTTVNGALDPSSGVTNVVTAADNAAIYVPRILANDSLNAGQIDSFAPCGAVAGVIASTDARRGVWKAPAGTEAVMRGVAGFSLGGSPGTLTDADNARLGSVGINCLRSFAGIGSVVWGARTLKGADALASEWKYIPVRRLADHIEESVFRGTRWVLFEPNAAPLWAQVRADVAAFMQTLFVRGAFPAATPAEAYFVRCDSTTTTLADIDAGAMNIWIGFASIRAAEFVLVQIRQVWP